MVTTPYLTTSEAQAHLVRAHRLRAAAVAGLFSDLGRWLSNSFHFGWISTAAR